METGTLFPSGGWPVLPTEKASDMSQPTSSSGSVEVRRRETPYAKIPATFMRDPGVSHSVKALYGILWTYSQLEGEGERICWPTIATLQADLACSEMSVHNWVKALKDLKMMEVEERPGTSNLYILLFEQADLPERFRGLPKRLGVHPPVPPGVHPPVPKQEPVEQEPGKPPSLREARAGTSKEVQARMREKRAKKSRTRVNSEPDEITKHLAPETSSSDERRRPGRKTSPGLDLSKPIQEWGPRHFVEYFEERHRKLMFAGGSVKRMAILGSQMRAWLEIEKVHPEHLKAMIEMYEPHATTRDPVTDFISRRSTLIQRVKQNRPEFSSGTENPSFERYGEARESRTSFEAWFNHYVEVHGREPDAELRETVENHFKELAS